MASQRAVSLIHPTLRTQCLHKFIGYLDGEDLNNATVRKSFPTELNPTWKSYDFRYQGPENTPIYTQREINAKL